MSRIDEYRELVRLHNRARSEFATYRGSLRVTGKVSGETLDLLAEALADERFETCFRAVLNRYEAEARKLATDEAAEFLGEQRP